MNINCNLTSTCPKGFVHPRSLTFIFFGCWGVYCKDGPNVIYKPSLGSNEKDTAEIVKDKKAFKLKLPSSINYDEFREWNTDLVSSLERYEYLKTTNILYGQQTVARLMEDYSNKNHITAVLIGGDNVYQDSFNPLEYTEYYDNFKREYANILQTSDNKKEIKKLEKKYSVLLHNIEKQYNVGFLDCFKNITTQDYLIGIGNHDIKSCDLFNREMNLFKKNIPGLYFNYTYTLQTGKIVNFIFIDTNMYDYEDDENGQPEEAPYCSGYYTQNDRNLQESWLVQLLNNNIDSWNILIGHIPFKYVSSKHQNAVETAKYFDIFMQKFNDRIDLYLCADKHNQQYIKHPNRPPEVICGSGGTEPDIFTNINLQPINSENLYSAENTDIRSVKYFDSVFGFAGLTIEEYRLVIDFRGINVLETRKRVEDRIINNPITFTIYPNDKRTRSNS
jgi:hypothetical protein